MAERLPKAVYDEESDSLYIIVAHGSLEGFKELAPNIHLEVGKDGKVIGIEILKATKVLEAAKKPLQILRSR